jgi:hypothetical protein
MRSPASACPSHGPKAVSKSGFKFRIGLRFIQLEVIIMMILFAVRTFTKLIQTLKH